MRMSTDMTSNTHENGEPMMAAGSESAMHLGEPRSLHDDPYADNELITRHERTERAIRKAQEQ